MSHEGPKLRVAYTKEVDPLSSCTEREGSEVHVQPASTPFHPVLQRIVVGFRLLSLFERCWYTPVEWLIAIFIKENCHIWVPVVGWGGMWLVGSLRARRSFKVPNEFREACRSLAWTCALYGAVTFFEMGARKNLRDAVENKSLLAVWGESVEFYELGQKNREIRNKFLGLARNLPVVEKHRALTGELAFKVSEGKL